MQALVITLVLFNFLAMTKIIAPLEWTPIGSQEIGFKNIQIILGFITQLSIAITNQELVEYQ